MGSRVAFRTCPLCEATCGLAIELDGDVVTGIRGDPEDPFSKGFICPKGAVLGALHDDPDRLRVPLVRRDGVHVEVGWDEAFAEIDRRLGAIRTEHGDDAVAVYVGNPNVHTFGNTLALRPLLKALRTRNVFSASTVDQMPKHVSCGLMFGHPLLIPVPDIDRTDLLLILGANPLESNGSLATAPDWPGRLAAIRKRGGRVIVVDPRRTRTAERADLHVEIRPGTDAALLAAIAATLFSEDLVRVGRLETAVAGLEALRTAIELFTPARVAELTGVPAATTVALARELAAARTAVVYGRIGTHTTAFGSLAAWLVDVLNLLTGNLDRPGGAMLPHAAHEPPRRRRRGFDVGRWHSRVRGLPEVMGEFPVSTLADEIETPGEGQVRAFVTIGGNPCLTTPDGHSLDRALEGIELMISVDPYLNATTRHADVILPPPSALERPHYDLAFTALSVRNVADYSPTAVRRADDRPSEFQLLVRLTGIALGLGPNVDPDALTETALTAQLASLTADPDSPVHGREPTELLTMLDGDEGEERSLDLLLRTGHRGDAFGAREGGLSLAVLRDNPHGLDLGSLEPRLPEALATVSGGIEIAPELLIGDLDRLRTALDVPVNGGMVLIGRRQLRTANSWTHNIEALVRGKDSCTAQMHPDDIDRLNLDGSQRICISTPAGSIELPVQSTDRIARGVVSVPYGWGHGALGSRQGVAAAHPGVNVNVLTDSRAIDPISGTAVLNGIPVSVTPV